MVHLNYREFISEDECDVIVNRSHKNKKCKNLPANKDAADIHKCKAQ
jgi:hypothetical protein